MLEFIIGAEDRPLEILCLGAHCDDIEIGCGATILGLLKHRSSLSITWIVFSSNDVRAAETRASFNALTRGAANAVIEIYEYRNGYFPFVGADIKDCFENVKSRIQPDLIFTHYGQDRHQDHRTISELTWNTFRDHCILEYEIPKFDGGLGTPNVYVPAANEHVEAKSETLMDAYVSQRRRPWFSRETFDSMMRLRGIECNSNSGFAEGFYARKLVVG